MLALITNFFTLRIRRLPVGRAWEALREDEIACRALGINPTSVKLSAFAIGAMFGGFAGCFFATRQGFISPESFTFIESATILAIVVLGGMGSQLGVVLAALVLVTLPEFGRAFAEFRMLVFGAAMVAIMVWRPRGLLSHRDPSICSVPQPLRARRGERAARPAAPSRASVDAVRRPRRGGRFVVHGVPARDHRGHRAERRGQDDGVQLPHRVLPAEFRPARAHGETGTATRSFCSNEWKDFASHSLPGWRARFRTSGCSPACRCSKT